MAAPTAADIAAGVPAQANIVKRVVAPGGGEYLLGADGGVFAIGGAQYGGSYFDDAYMGGPQHRNDPNRQFSDLVLDPRGGYKIISTQGSEYNFAPEYQKRFGARNPLAEDPAWAAFLRTSGLEYDQVAADVARRKMAIETALGLEIPEIQAAGETARQGIDNSFEARGVYRSGIREQKRGEQESQQAAQVGRARLGAVTQLGGLESDLTNTVAGIQRKGAELGSSIAGNQYGSELEKSLAGIRQRAEDDESGLRRKIMEWS